MINRELKKVIYRAFDNTKDAYGQVKQSSTDTDIEMMIKIRNQITVEDPRFVDCDCIGIYKGSLKEGNHIIDGDKTYLIKYVIPSSRYQQVFLKCVR